MPARLVMITREPGIGRSALLTRALDFADRERDLLVRLEPSGEQPFAALALIPSDIS